MSEVSSSVTIQENQPESITRVCRNPLCARAGEPQPIYNFYRHKRAKETGYRSVCKVCFNLGVRVPAAEKPLSGEMRTCRKCGQAKDSTLFRRERNGRYRLNCKTCERASEAQHQGVSEVGHRDVMAEVRAMLFPDSSKWREVKPLEDKTRACEAMTRYFGWQGEL